MTHDLLGPAQAAALEIARRLREPDLLQRAALASVEQSAHPEVVRWRPHSLSHGNAGLAVLFETLDTCFPGQGWDLEARRHMEAAARSAEAAHGLGAPLFGQLAGVAFAAWYLSRNGRRYRKLSAALDEALLPCAEAAADRLDSMSGGCPVHLFDLVSGLTGTGVYLLCRSEQEGAQRGLLRALRCLVALTTEEDGLPRWRTPRHLLSSEEQIKRFPDGNLNCGLAHGIPGPLGLMSLARSLGVSTPGLDEGIERAVAWLLAHRVNDHGGASWPAFYPLSRRGEPLASEAIPLPCKAAWCYGSPGVSRALYLAGRALARPEWCQIAVDAMRAAVTRPVEERHIPSPTFCHGAAGLLQITLRFALDTGLPVFEQAIGAVLAQLLGAHEPASILGFRSIDASGTRVDDPGLLDGAAGVCLVLLAATTRREPSWDRFLLLS